MGFIVYVHTCCGIANKTYTIQVFWSILMTVIGSCSEWQKVCFPNLIEKILNSRKQKIDLHFVTS